MIYEQIASVLGCDADDVRWFTWLSLWGLVGQWCLHPPHVRALVGLAPIEAVPLPSMFFAPSVEK